MRRITILSVCFIVVLVLSFTSSMMASDEDDVLEAYENSCNAINSLDADLMSSFWFQSKGASCFTPPIEGAFLTQGYDEIYKYNKEMSQMEPGAFTMSLHNSKATMLGDSVAVTTGYITAVITDPLTKAQTISLARQTLVWQKVSGKWLVVHMHASELPTE